MPYEGIPEPLRPTHKAIEAEDRQAPKIRTAEHIPRDVFVKRWGEKKVAADEEQYVKIRNSEDYRIDKTEHGVFLEMLFSRAKKLGFFGNAEVRVVKTHHLDDVLHGVDFAIELTVAEGKHAILGFDVTTGETDKKVTRCRNRLKSGELFNLDYYVDPDDATKVGIGSIPNFILAIEKEELDAYLENVGDAVTEQGLVVRPEKLSHARQRLIEKMQENFRAQLEQQVIDYWFELERRGDLFTDPRVGAEFSTLVHARKYKESHEYLMAHAQLLKEQHMQSTLAFGKFLMIGIMAERYIKKHLH